ncbi:MAG: hypothetical protein FGM33_00345 [Candidatus Kapabacteria bacterium]|nr:hypothetical protein [Candidatus Kapabacteria bacterium]
MSRYIRTISRVTFSDVAWLPGLLILSAVMLSSVVAFAQNPTPPQPNAPLELPDFLVTGKAVVDVAAGAKHLPSKPPTFSLGELDSLNPTEKLPPPLAARRPLPLFSRIDASVPGYVAVDAGAYLTPSVLAGYSARSGGYTLDMSGGLEHSQGWVDGAGYTTAQARLNTSYVAPDKFLFFGKGLTETDLRVRNQSYTLYGDTAMLERSSLALSAALTTEAKVDSVSVLGSFGWSRLGLQTSASDMLPGAEATDNALSANISATWLGSQIHSSVNLDLRMQSLNGSSYSFFEAGYGMRMQSHDWSVAASAAPQIASASSGDGRYGLALRASAETSPWLHSVFRAEVSSGMRSSSYAELARINPYLSDSVAIDHAYDRIAARASLRFTPSLATSLVGSIEFRSTARELVWQDAPDGRFTPSFRSVTSLRAGIEGAISVTPRDIVMGELNLTSAATDSSGQQTYVPLVQATIGYERLWMTDLRSMISLLYVGQRWTDLANSRSIDAFIDLRASLTYTINKSFDVQLTGENLVNSSVFLWNNYRGRGIFVSIGLLWKF